MSRLIDDLLAFSRLGRMPLNSVLTDMEKLVHEVLRDLASAPDEHLPAVQIEPLPAAECDPALIRQVWINLLANAIKFSGQREDPRIRIQAELQAARTVFSVHDNGIGFDMAYYDKLFGVFQRLHHADEFSGTGVGLATVQRIVTRHGGEVWAESTLNGGATFYFSLPRGGLRE